MSEKEPVGRLGSTFALTDNKLPEGVREALPVARQFREILRRYGDDGWVIAGVALVEAGLMPTAEYDRRVNELLRANNELVEKDRSNRRAIESLVDRVNNLQTVIHAIGQNWRDLEKLVKQERFKPFRYSGSSDPLYQAHGIMREMYRQIETLRDKGKSE